MDVVDAEGLEGGAEDEDNKLGNRRRVTFKKTLRTGMDVKHFE